MDKPIRKWRKGEPLMNEEKPVEAKALKWCPQHGYPLPCAKCGLGYYESGKKAGRESLAGDIPHFSSEDEEREFWATHDSVSFVTGAEPKDGYTAKQVLELAEKHLGEMAFLLDDNDDLQSIQ